MRGEGVAKMAQAILPIRGFQLHITHYDPEWCEAKDEEEPFDLDVGIEIVDCMASAGLNLLVIDCADGVIYESHPELARHYSQPMSILKRLVQRTNHHGIEVVPILNFDQSGVFRGNHWFRPHNKLFDSEEYWTYAFEVMDELIRATDPPRFFHIGMAEDHWRSHRQYVEAIKILREGLRDRGLRAVIWNASALAAREFEAFKEKSMVAEEAIPRDVVHVLFDYRRVQPEIFRRILGAGFDLWGAPSGFGEDPAQVEHIRDVLLRYGGNGILLTRWIPCVQANREILLSHIRMLGVLCSQAT
jgi:hypothetical protein